MPAVHLILKTDHVRPVPIQSGLATMEDGTSVDLLKISGCLRPGLPTQANLNSWMQLMSFPSSPGEFPCLVDSGSAAEFRSPRPALLGWLFVLRHIPVVSAIPPIFTEETKMTAVKTSPAAEAFNLAEALGLPCRQALPLGKKT